jgi:hypothetical protein
MRPVGAVSRILGFAVAVAALLSAATAQAAPEQNKAIVRTVRGTANFSTDRGANWRALKVGTALTQNSVVRTAPGSVVDLYLGDNGPLVRVTEDTTLGIDRLTIDRTGVDKVIETQLDLRNGRILGNVKKLAAASKYEVKTPQGVAGIRGTRYDIRSDGTIIVVEGQIVAVYIVNGQAYTATGNAGDILRPPTPGTPQVLVSPAPPTVITDINNQLNEGGRATGGGPGVAGTPGGVTPITIVTVDPIKEQLQEGDPFKLPELPETPVTAAD